MSSAYPERDRGDRTRLNPWLGQRRGHLSDWTTQQWVRRTGRRFEPRDEPWLDGPWAPTTGIGERYFEDFAARHGLELGTADGLLPSFDTLRSEAFEPGDVDPRIAEFYERTGRFRLQLWSQWSPIHRPFGQLIDRIFARRLGQLRLPLAPLDTSRGVTSELLSLRTGGGERLTAWLRRRLPAGEGIYAGCYSVATPPRAPGPCVRTVFPLPNGSASVFLQPTARPDGSLELVSPPARFGGAGFYFVVRDGPAAWAKTVPAMTEQIRVYAGDSELRTDHTLRIWGRTFLRLHYAMEPA
jgi:hypothetical protein